MFDRGCLFAPLQIGPQRLGQLFRRRFGHQKPFKKRAKIPPGPRPWKSQKGGFPSRNPYVIAAHPETTGQAIGLAQSRVKGSAL